MLKFAGFVILIFILTTLTQTGGLILLCCIPLFRRVDRHVKDDIKRKALKLSLFIAAYLLASVTILPLSARQFGRVPLPVFSNDQLRPLNIFTCVLNRHYVSPRLLRATESVAEELEKLQPGTVLSYLDAGFPFINGFPLLPHLSHDDGEKLDIALMYANSLTNDPTPNDAPSCIGYGVYEEPSPNQTNTAEYCEKKGYWQYGFLRYLVPQRQKDGFVLDESRTKTLVNLFAAEKAIGKIFIEPHLKKRLKLTSSKIRFHGCQAVRHDDHVHVQLK